MLIGGWTFTYIGGYNSPRALPVAATIMVMAGCSGFPIVFATNFYLSASLLWFQFFFGGFCIPVLTGILLNTCPPQLRTIANSIANLVQNLVGYLPAPYIYGVVYQVNGGGKSRAGMLALQTAALASNLLLVVLYFKVKVTEREDRKKHHKKYA